MAAKIIPLRRSLASPMRQVETRSRTVADLRPTRKEAERLGVDLDSLQKRLIDHHRRISKFSDAPGLIADQRGTGAPRVRVCIDRGGRDQRPKREERR
jgi:hypothetical protein